MEGEDGESLNDPTLHQLLPAGGEGQEEVAHDSSGHNQQLILPHRQHVQARSPHLIVDQTGTKELGGTCEAVETSGGVWACVWAEAKGIVL